MPDAAYCERCEQRIREPRPRQRYCSRSCKETDRVARRRAEARSRRQCRQCNAPIAATSNRTRYCSQACASVAARRQVIEWHIERGRRSQLDLVYGYIGNDGDYSTSVYKDLLRLDPCAICGHESAHVDHVTPRSQGGEDTWDNLTPLCHLCNQRKAHHGLLLGMLRCDGLRRARATLLEYGELFKPNVQIRNLDRPDLVR